MRRLFFILFVLFVINSVFFEKALETKEAIGLSVYQIIALGIFFVLIMAFIIAYKIIKVGRDNNCSITIDKQKEDPNITEYGTVKRE